MRSTVARVGWMVAVAVVCGLSLVCGPAVQVRPTQSVAPVDFSASPALQLALAAAAPEAPAVADPVVPAPAAATVAAPAKFVPPTSIDQWFAPSGRNAGTEGLAMILAGIALKDNAPLYISDTWGRTDGATTSDHSIAQTTSWAIDVAVRGIQVPTPQTYEAAKRISTALGEPNWGSGDLTKTINGYRFQVLWLVDGHFNHVHVGVRKVG